MCVLDVPFSYHHFNYWTAVGHSAHILPAPLHTRLSAYQISLQFKLMDNLQAINPSIHFASLANGGSGSLYAYGWGNYFPFAMVCIKSLINKKGNIQLVYFFEGALTVTVLCLGNRIVDPYSNSDWNYTRAIILGNILGQTGLFGSG